MCIYAILSIPLLFITHKIVNYFSPGKLNKVLMHYGWNALELCSRAEIYYMPLYNTYIRPWFVRKPQAAIVIRFIRNGEETAEYSYPDFLKKKKDSNYDFILCEIPVKTVGTYDKYDTYTLRCEKDTDVTYEKLFNEYDSSANSAIELNTIQFTFKNSTDNYSIDFKRNQFMNKDNVLFDRPFLKWYLKQYHSTPLTDKDKYTVTFIDHNMNYIIIPEYCYILVNKHGYDIINVIADNTTSEDAAAGETSDTSGSTSGSTSGTNTFGGSSDNSCDETESTTNMFEPSIIQ